MKNDDYNSKKVTEKLSKLSANYWNKKVKPSLTMGENLGNIYTGSLYAGLCSLICNETIDLRVKLFAKPIKIIILNTLYYF